MTGEGLSPAARALLDAARDGMAPDAAAIGRVKAKVVSTAGATASTAIAIKLGIMAIVVTIAAGAAIYGNRSRAVTSPRIELTATRESTARVAQVRPDSSTTTAPAASTLSDAPIEMAPDHVMRARSTAAHAIPKLQLDLAREVELLDLAMSALRRGDTTNALVAVRMHASETRGVGQLAEDAAAIEIEALCRQHDPSVVAKLASFDARFPRSAQRSRLSATCP